MTDLAGSLAFGGITFATRPAGIPEPSAANALPVFQGASALTNQGDQSTVEEAPPAFPISLPGPKIDENTLAGPPPAFKVSLLELDKELQESLARINAEMGFGAPEVQPIELDSDEAGRNAQQLDERASEDDDLAGRPAMTGRTSMPDDQGPAPVAAEPSAKPASDDRAETAMMGQMPGSTVEVPQLDGELA